VQFVPISTPESKQVHLDTLSHSYFCMPNSFISQQSAFDYAPHYLHTYPPYNIMNKSKLISESTSFLPKTTPLKSKLKNISNIYMKPEPLNNSKLSIKSATSSLYIKLPNSFYNDRKNIYQTRSRILSEKTLSFQNKPLTISQRKRYESSKTEEIVGKR
jgi:hypothetical protein